MNKNYNYNQNMSSQFHFSRSSCRVLKIHMTNTLFTKQSYLSVHSTSVSECVERTRNVNLSTSKEKLSPGFNQHHIFVLNGKN